MNATPTQLVFRCDAFLPVAFTADWTYIAERKQRLIDQNNARENKKRKPHAYQVGDRVMIRHDPNHKHGDDSWKGPFCTTLKAMGFLFVVHFEHSTYQSLHFQMQLADEHRAFRYRLLFIREQLM